MRTPTVVEEIRDLYRKRAKHYDITANLYYLVGFRIQAYRKKAVAALRLRPGDTVVDIGCGTGLNFAFLQRAVGPHGKIIGVDITDAMLEKARNRVRKNGWTNVELIQQDAATFVFPQRVDGMLATFALSLMPGLDRVIRNGAAALAPGKRMVILDLKLPSNWMRVLAPFLVWITRPFGVTRELADARPWETIWTTMSRCSLTVTVDELYFGCAYIAIGERTGVTHDHSARPG